MQKFEFDFKNKNNEEEFARYFYQAINEIIGDDALLVLSSIHPDGLYDDLFGLLSNEEFINKFGRNIHFILKNTNEFKNQSPEAYKYLIIALDSTKDELHENKYMDEKVNFSYEILD